MQGGPAEEGSFNPRAKYIKPQPSQHLAQANERKPDEGTGIIGSDVAQYRATGTFRSDGARAGVGFISVQIGLNGRVV